MLQCEISYAFAYTSAFAQKSLDTLSVQICASFQDSFSLNNSRFSTLLMQVIPLKCRCSPSHYRDPTTRVRAQDNSFRGFQRKLSAICRLQSLHEANGGLLLSVKLRWSWKCFMRWNLPPEEQQLECFVSDLSVIGSFLEVVIHWVERPQFVCHVSANWSDIDPTVALHGWYPSKRCNRELKD